MLTLAIFDCNADELIIDPALRAKWHIDLISAHDVIDNGISAGIIAAFVKADIPAASAQWPRRLSEQHPGTSPYRRATLP